MRNAIPVAALAKQLGWHVTVADGRPAYAKADRFPGADSVVLLPAPVEISSRSVVLFLTHNYPLDLKLLGGVIGRGLTEDNRRRGFRRGRKQIRPVNVHHGIDDRGDGAGKHAGIDGLCDIADVVPGDGHLEHRVQPAIERRYADDEDANAAAALGNHELSLSGAAQRSFSE